MTSRPQSKSEADHESASTPESGAESSPGPDSQLGPDSLSGADSLSGPDSWSARTFKVDNQLVQNVPQLFASQRRSGQLFRQGLAPFGPFDYWATLAIYSLLDPDHPEYTIKTSYTELLRILEFARQVCNAQMGYETYPTAAYRLVEDSLQRLFSIEVQWRHFWKVKGPGKKSPRFRQWVEFRGRILSSYAFVYAPGITPPALLPQAQRINVNRALDQGGDPGPPIYKLAAGPRPVAVEIGISSELVRGLTGEDPNIGATILPLQIFKLRERLGPYPIATRLMMWVCRQTARTTTRRLDGLVEELDIRGKDHKRNRESILESFRMLLQAGVVAEYQVEISRAGEPLSVTFTKGAGWYFPRAAEGQELPEPPPPGKRQGLT